MTTMKAKKKKPVAVREDIATDIPVVQAERHPDDRDHRGDD